MDKIKFANACYTGGNIYIYYGQLENGLFFRACDEWEEIEICNADTSTEEADYYEFYQEHSVKTLVGDSYKKFLNDMLNWIISNNPSGNYSEYELEKRLIEYEEEETYTFTLTESEMKMIRTSLDFMGDNKADETKAKKYYELAEKIRRTK